MKKLRKVRVGQLDIIWLHQFEPGNPLNYQQEALPSYVIVPMGMCSDSVYFRIHIGAFLGCGVQLFKEKVVWNIAENDISFAPSGVYQRYIQSVAKKNEAAAMDIDMEIQDGIRDMIDSLSRQMYLDWYRMSPRTAA